MDVLGADIISIKKHKPSPTTKISKDPMRLSSRISIFSMQMLVYLQVVLISSVHFQSVQASSPGNETDRLALLHFKESITSDPLGTLNSWNSSIPHCSWSGVTCNIRHRMVANLTLKGQKLSGPISPHIGNLSFLRVLNLRNNSFHGEIPQQVGKLFRLQKLYLNNNTLGGEIPINLTSCSNLEALDLQFNNLSGKIPPLLGSLLKLQLLGLSANTLSGMIPSSLGNLTSLQQLSVAGNRLVGEIPGELSGLTKLTVFFVGLNNVSGVIPPFLFNISSMETLSLADNKFHGGLPDKGFNLPNLVDAGFRGNQLSGKIPSSFTNASQLQIFDIGDNNFVGPVPSNIGDLSSLRKFNIEINNIGRNSADDLDFLASLARCRNLETLAFGKNNIGGVLPDSIANFSSRLNRILASDNQIYGKIPPAFYNLTGLVILALEDNHLIGSIPSYIGKLQKLQALLLDRNMLSGSIPSSIGNLSQLSDLRLYSNKLEGVIPPSIGNCQHLNSLYLDENNLTGKIPDEILNIPSLSVYFGVSGNRLSGALPLTIGKLTTTAILNVSNNLLSGEIPSTIEGCVSLVELYMQGNSFRGEIPEAMASLKGIQILDLSQNNMTGKIPKALQNLTYLQYLNISFNNLEGEVPTGGVFGNASAIFLEGNSRLCGGIPELHLPKCPSARSKKRKTAAKLKLPIVMACVLLFVATVVVLLLLFRKKRSKPKPTSSMLGPKPHIMVSYKNIHDATSGFSSRNLLGYGSFGSVYKGLLDRVERPVAVKVLNLEQQGAAKSIVAECNALSNIRHRNLVKLITYCSSLDYQGNDFKALVFEFMPNGNLENWLHSEVNQPSRRLNMQQRLSIAIDVASALHYLHDLSEVPIVHRDLKPSNVLLDDDMVAHVGDFGLAKLLLTPPTALESQTSTLAIPGTTGYVAPEYGQGVAPSKEGDIYSYGILLLEMFSGRRPTDDIFVDGLTLVDITKEALPENAIQVADPILLVQENDETEATSSSTPPARDEHRTVNNMKMRQHEARCLTSVLEIAVSCSEESPCRRANLGDVLRKLHKVKDTFMSAQLIEDRRRSRQPREYYYH